MMSLNQIERQEIAKKLTNLSDKKRIALIKLLTKEGIDILKLPIAPAIRESNRFPLSWAQERMWLIEQLEGVNATYNDLWPFHIKGNFNCDVLQSAISEIFRRHEVLRTRFESIDGVPLQIVEPSINFEIQVTDWQNLHPTQQQTDLEKYLEQERKKSFNLAKGSLLRVNLVKLSTIESILLITTHHIIWDIWSLGIFFKELSILYTAYSQGKISPLPELSIQYADFAVWQRQYLSGEILLTQLNYWKQNLANAPQLLQLPTDRPRPKVQRYIGETHNRNLDTEITEKLQNLSQQNGTTLFMTLLAAFTTLLYRYSGQSDILIGSPIANRNRSEIESLIGVFINTLVLRTAFLDNPSFEELLAQVRETTMKAYEYQDVPFGQVVEALQPQRSLSHSPLFQVMFVLQNVPIGKVDKLPGVSVSSINQDTKIARFDLTLSMSETESGLVGGWQYNTDLFDSSTIERMANHFENLLSAVVENPAQKVDELPLLSAAERHQLLVEWNDTAVEYPKDQCIHQLFEAQVDKTPDAVAVEFEGKQLTYSKLNESANQLAHYLQNLGVKPETLVGICLERSVEMVIGLLGILKAGGAYVPIDPTYPTERLSYMLEDAAVPVLLSTESILEHLPEHSVQTVCLDRDWDNIAISSIENLDSGVTQENLAYTIYTSGSTGKPKGCMNTHRGIYNRLLWMQDTYQLTAQDRILQKTPFSFDVSVWEFFWPLITGATLVVAAPEIHKDSEALINLIIQQQITTIHFVPSMLSVFLQGSKIEECSSLKRVICSGEALSYQLQEQFQEKLKCELHNLYGPTEAAIDVTFIDCGTNKYPGIVPIGRPIANTQLYILDRNNQPLPIGVSGELHIGGAGLARRYLNHPELTAEKFIPNPFDNNNSKLYKTGDLVRYLPDGNIEYIGRIDNQVKIRGFRIELGEIEVLLNNHYQIKQAVVIAREDIPGNKCLVAYLVASDKSLTTKELREFTKQKLPEYMVPSAFVTLDSLPLTPSGKIDRKGLPAPDGVLEEHEYVAPRNQSEEIIANIFANVLAIKKVGIYDNFFDLGGHSLLATQVISRLREAFSVEIPLQKIFESPTVAELDQKISELHSTNSGLSIPPIQPVSRELNLPLSFNQQRLWFIDQLEKNSGAYNIFSAVRLSGHLDLEVLQQAFTEIIRRHETLRTSFQEVDGEAVQVISDQTNFTLSVIDWREVDETNREMEIHEFATSEAQRPFDLSKNPLLRVTLLQLTDTEYVLIFVIHHIICDEWSIAITTREFATLYDAFASGKRSLLPELSIQYADFAHWQQEYLQSEVFAEQLTYWQQQLAEVPTVLALPTDRPRPKVQNFQGATIIFELPSQLSDNIKQVSQSEKVTLFMMLLTGFQTLLYCSSQQQDFCIGYPIANRNSREKEGIIGFFVNTLVLRAQLSGNPSFRELLQRVREVAIGAFANQDLPFEKLLEELNIERSLSHNPLFQVWFVLHNVSMPQLEMGGCRLEPLHFDSGLVKHDLRLGLQETPTGFVGSFQYRTDLFDAETINLMVKDLENIFSHIVANLDMRLNEMLDIINESKKQQQVMEEQKLENKNRQKLKKMKRKSAK
ncbi:MAG: amino acid adenylation domain-containing protein [Cyanobacteria bacterium P01_H01_bin.35]